jgi:hypothetical protein
MGRLMKIAVVALALAGFLALPAAACAWGPVGATFSGGSLTGLEADPSFTQATVQNFSYGYDDCGTEPAELTCTWRIRMTLGSDPATRCSSATPASQPIWDSGERSGNGSIESGPLAFALEGCRGQTLGAYIETWKTYDPEEQEGPFIVTGSGWSATLFQVRIGNESLREAEEKVIAANPPSRPYAEPPPATLSIGADCRSLTIDSERFVFFFRRLGCHKAVSLARAAYLSGSDPSGYRCQDRPSGGILCRRQGHRKKLFGWRPPKR